MAGGAGPAAAAGHDGGCNADRRATQHRDRPHDPERSSPRKGRHDDFGLKAPIGVDADSGLLHTLAVTPAKVTDGRMTDALRHGAAAIVLGDRAYTRNDRNLAAEREGHDPVWAFPFQRKPGEAARPAEQALLNRRRAPPCRLVKRPFGHVKVRYRGLSKNAQQRYLRFALGNLYQARGALLAA